MKYDLVQYEELESTNLTLTELAKSGATEFTTVIAKKQTRGRGRLQRSFYSDGGLYMSVLLKPYDLDGGEALTTLYTAVCVCKALRKVCRANVGIKWVNDIIADGGKVSGILCESHKNSDGDTDMIIGIGINLGNIDFPQDLEGIAYSVPVPEKKRERVRKKLADHIVKQLSKYPKQLKSKRFLEYYRMNCRIIDKKVTVSGDGDPYEAIVMGISDDGGLMVFSRKGAKILKYGEISVRPISEDKSESSTPIEP